MGLEVPERVEGMGPYPRGLIRSRDVVENGEGERYDSSTHFEVLIKGLREVGEEGVKDGRGPDSSRGQEKDFVHRIVTQENCQVAENGSLSTSQRLVFTRNRL
jgi:hypothetical protein